MRFQGLDLNLLITLEVILVQRNLTKAAEILNLTQPAVSNAMTKLREHFHDDLLERHGREMQRSPFGQSLLKPLQETLQHVRSIALARPHFDPATASRVYKIVASDFISVTLLNDLVLRVARLAPNVTIEQLPLNDDSIGKVSRGDADTFIYPHGRQTISAFLKHNLFTDHFVCIASRSNTQLGSRMSKEQFYALPRAVPPYKTYLPEATCEITITGPSIAMPFLNIPWFVAKSAYVAMIPQRLAVLYERILPLRRITITESEPPITFIAQSHPSASTDAFKMWMLEQLQEVAQAPREVTALATRRQVARPA